MGFNMTVRELTEYLLREDPDMEVTVNGYEDGLDSINNIFHKLVKPHSNPQWYYGKYEECVSGKVVIVLSRY
jgi:hypothetical protein